MSETTPRIEAWNKLDLLGRGRSGSACWEQAARRDDVVACIGAHWRRAGHIAQPDGRDIGESGEQVHQVRVGSGRWKPHCVAAQPRRGHRTSELMRDEIELFPSVLSPDNWARFQALELA